MHTQYVKLNIRLIPFMKKENLVVPIRCSSLILIHGNGNAGTNYNVCVPLQVYCILKNFGWNNISLWSVDIPQSAKPWHVSSIYVLRSSILNSLSHDSSYPIVIVIFFDRPIEHQCLMKSTSVEQNCCLSTNGK